MSWFILCPIPNFGIQFQLLVKVASRSEVLHCVSVSTKQPLGGQKSLNAHRSTSVDAPGADPNLCSETESISVGKPRTGIVEDAGTVHAAEELLSCVIWEEGGDWGGAWLTIQGSLLLENIINLCCANYCHRQTLQSPKHILAWSGKLDLPYFIYFTLFTQG